MAGTGADLENTSLAWLDQLAGLGDGTKTAQNAILANSVEQMLEELRKRYQKINDAKRKDPESRSNVYSGQQLAARIENTLELLPTWKRRELGELYERDLRTAQALGADAGLHLDKILKNRDKTLNQNAKPNLDAINAANRRLNQFWEKENSQFTDRVKALTRNAAAQGMSWRQLEKQVRELLILEAPTASDRSKRVNQRYGIPGRAEMIARTELAAVFINGQVDNFRRMGYDYGRWSAAAERTCGYCMSRDGLVYEIEELEQSLPAHPRCRCSIIPVDVPEKMRKGGPTGPEAAKDLDDAYWTKSRNDKLKQWKDENKGIRDPKTEQILNDMLRNYARTPTNTQKYLRPGTEAPKPFWAPSGEVIPDMGATAANTKKAAEDAKRAEAKRLQEEAEAAARAEAEEKARLEAQRLKEQEEAAAKAEEEKKAAEAKLAKLRKEQAPKLGADGLQPKSNFTPSVPKLKSEDFNKLPVKDQNTLLKLLHPGRAKYFKDLKKLGGGKLSPDDVLMLEYELGLKVHGPEWSSKQTTTTPEGKAAIHAAFKAAWNKAHAKPLTSEQLDQWVKDANPNFAGDVYKLDWLDTPDMKQFQQFFKEVEAAGGNVTALRAMAKMMREQDLMIAWGGKKPGSAKASPESEEMKADPRSKNFKYMHGNKSSLPGGNTFGHTSGVSQYVGMNTFSLNEYFPFKASNMDGKFTRDMVSKHLKELEQAHKLDWDQFPGNYSEQAAAYSKARTELVGRNWSTSVRLAERMETANTEGINKLVAGKNMVTLLHELGHQMQYWADKRVEGKPMTFLGAGNGKLFGRGKLPGGKEMGKSTEYSKTNVMEQFAEDWVFYTMDREGMRKIMPKIVEHMDKLMEDIFTNDHYGNAPTYEEMMRWRPKLGTTKGESLTSGTTNASEVS